MSREVTDELWSTMAVGIVTRRLRYGRITAISIVNNIVKYLPSSLVVGGMGWPGVIFTGTEETLKRGG